MYFESSELQRIVVHSRAVNNPGDPEQLGPHTVSYTMDHGVTWTACGSTRGSEHVPAILWSTPP